MSVLGGRSAGRSRARSAKFELILTTRFQYLGGPLAKVGLSAKLGVLVFKASLLDYWGDGVVHLPKYVHLPSFVYQYSRHLCSINWGSIGQRRFVCQI